MMRQAHRKNARVRLAVGGLAAEAGCGGEGTGGAVREGNGARPLAEEGPPLDDGSPPDEARELVPVGVWPDEG